MVLKIISNFINIIKQLRVFSKERISKCLISIFCITQFLYISYLIKIV